MNLFLAELYETTHCALLKDVGGELKNFRARGISRKIRIVF